MAVRCGLLVLILSIMEFAAGMNESIYFIYGSPGSSTRQITPGIYGGNFKVGESSNNMDLEEIDIRNAEYDDQFWNWISPLYLSYDPISKYVLTVLSHSRTHSMARIDACEHGKSVTDQSMYFWGIDDLHTGPFALYNSEVYFVAQDKKIENYETVIKTLTIRKLVRCLDHDNTFIKSDGFDDRSCSVEVGRILEGINFTLSGDPSTERNQFLIKTFLFRGYSLLVVPNGDDLHFLVQMVVPLRGREGDLTIDLYEVKQGQPAKMLYSQVINPDWWRYVIANTGEIAYKDGLLCWTAYSFILCAKWLPGQNIGKVHQVVAIGDVSEVCKLAGQYQDYKDITTGILIISASEPVQLLFGCWSDNKDSGGAGHVTIKNDWTDIEIKPVSDKKGNIIAASMVMIDDCSISRATTSTNSIAIANALLFLEIIRLMY